MLPSKKIGQRLARFRQINMDAPTSHHDAVEFPDGRWCCSRALARVNARPYYSCRPLLLSRKSPRGRRLGSPRVWLKERREILRLKEKGSTFGPFSNFWFCRSVIHAAHAITRHGRCLRLLLWRFGYHRLGSDEQACDRGRILQGRANHLGRIDDPLRHEIFELASLRVEAEGISVVVLEVFPSRYPE